MKATEFANFFEFEIRKGEIPDEFGDISKYDVVDCQGVFDTRHIDDVKDLVNCFDSMIDDYIFSNINYHLEEEGKDEIDFEYMWGSFDFEKGLEIAKEIYGEDGGVYVPILEAFVNPDLIEDDMY